MAALEIKVLSPQLHPDASLLFTAYEIQLGAEQQPLVYTAENIVLRDGKKEVLPVGLAKTSFDLPIKRPTAEIAFAWLDPSGDEAAGADPKIRQACAIETGGRLARKMEGKSKAIVLKAPSGKSGGMVDDAAQIAADLTKGEVLVVNAGGGVISEQAEKDDLHTFFAPEICAQLMKINLEAGQKAEVMELTTIAGEKALVCLYCPVTEKRKFMFFTESQLHQMQEYLEQGAVFTSIEDVVTTGTTVDVQRNLSRIGGIKEDLQVIAVAREGDSYPREKVDYAIQLPALD